MSKLSCRYGATYQKLPETLSSALIESLPMMRWTRKIKNSTADLISTHPRTKTSKEEKKNPLPSKAPTPA